MSVRLCTFLCLFVCVCIFVRLWVYFALCRSVCMFLCLWDCVSISVCQSAFRFVSICVSLSTSVNSSIMNLIHSDNCRRGLNKNEYILYCEDLHSHLYLSYISLLACVCIFRSVGLTVMLCLFVSLLVCGLMVCFFVSFCWSVFVPLFAYTPLSVVFLLVSLVSNSVSVSDSV